MVASLSPQCPTRGLGPQHPADKRNVNKEGAIQVPMASPRSGARNAKGIQIDGL